MKSALLGLVLLVGCGAEPGLEGGAWFDEHTTITFEGGRYSWRFTPDANVQLTEGAYDVEGEAITFRPTRSTCAGEKAWGVGFELRDSQLWLATKPLRSNFFRATGPAEIGTATHGCYGPGLHFEPAEMRDL